MKKRTIATLFFLSACTTANIPTEEPKNVFKIFSKKKTPEVVPLTTELKPNDTTAELPNTTVKRLSPKAIITYTAPIAVAVKAPITTAALPNDLIKEELRKVDSLITNLKEQVVLDTPAVKTMPKVSKIDKQKAVVIAAVIRDGASNGYKLNSPKILDEVSRIEEQQKQTTIKPKKTITKATNEQYAIPLLGFIIFIGVSSLVVFAYWLGVRDFKRNKNVPIHS